MSDLIGIIITFSIIVIMVASTVAYWGNITLPPQDWHCTASKVIREELPRQEECVTYSKKEGK